MPMRRIDQLSEAEKRELQRLRLLDQGFAEYELGLIDRSQDATVSDVEQEAVSEALANVREARDRVRDDIRSLRSTPSEIAGPDEALIAALQSAISDLDAATVANQRAATTLASAAEFARAFKGTV